MTEGLQTVLSTVDENILRFSRLKDSAFNHNLYEQRLVDLMRNTERHLEEFCGKNSLPLERIVQLHDTIERGLASLEANVSAIIQERRYKIEGQLNHFSQHNGIEFFGDTDYYSANHDNFFEEVSYETKDPMNDSGLENASLCCAGNSTVAFYQAQDLYAQQVVGTNSGWAEVTIDLCLLTPSDGHGTQPLPDLELDFSENAVLVDHRLVNYTIDFEAFIYDYGGQAVPDLMVDIK